MIITETFYARDRHEWRQWLQENHLTAKEIWLIYYKKESGQPRVPYEEAVEEALCFGWIDSTAKGIDQDSFAQRYTPRKKKSVLSELNKARFRKLIDNGQMTDAGLTAVQQYWTMKDGKPYFEPFKIPQDMLQILTEDPVVWQNFQNFPIEYQHIRLGFIFETRNRPEEYQKRFNYFIEMTRKNKMYGSMV